MYICILCVLCVYIFTYIHIRGIIPVKRPQMSEFEVAQIGNLKQENWWWTRRINWYHMIESDGGWNLRPKRTIHYKLGIPPLETIWSWKRVVASHYDVLRWLQSQHINASCLAWDCSNPQLSNMIKHVFSILVRMLGNQQTLWACWFAGIKHEALGKYNNLFEILRLEQQGPWAVGVNWPWKNAS